MCIARVSVQAFSINCKQFKRGEPSLSLLNLSVFEFNNSDF